MMTKNLIFFLLSAILLNSWQFYSVTGDEKRFIANAQHIITGDYSNFSLSESTSKYLSESENTHIEIPDRYLDNIQYDLFYNKSTMESFTSEEIFPKKYTNVEGVLTFRGNNLRNSAVYGETNIVEKQLEIDWSFTTSARSWGGGAGWTGQPAIIKWDDNLKQMMNIDDEFKKKDNFVEVIYGSLDGRIYFLDLETGEQTRKAIDIKNPIKGSLSLDPRGYPLLYIGQGIPETGQIGFRIYNLINGELLTFINGKDPIAYRGWGAFDSSPLINRETDRMLLGGENGLFYNVKLNTNFDLDKKQISINPDIYKYRYKTEGNKRYGIENSVAVYKNIAFFADNDGYIQAINLLNMKPIWVVESFDDTDATLVLEIVNDIPYIYSGTEVDLQGKGGYSYLRKIDGLTGEILWEVKYPCLYSGGEKPVNGGALATPAIGKESINNLVIYTLARYDKMSSGLMVALDKETGKEVWRWLMPYYSWSSPVDFYDNQGNAYLIQADSIGDTYLFDAKTGKLLDKVNLGSNIESSPAIYNDTIVVATRGQKIYGIKIK